MVWIGDPEERRVDTPERRELLTQRKELEQKVKELNAKPLPQGDREQMLRFRKLDLLELAKKIGKIDKKLGRTK